MTENLNKKSNLEICPNCLEPNEADLANCKYCGMPLHKTDENSPVSDNNVNETPSEEKGTEHFSSEPEILEKPLSPEEEKKKKEAAKKSRWGKAMSYVGIYIIVYAVMEIPKAFSFTEPKERYLTLLGDLIYMVAGLMLAWPLIREYKSKHFNKNKDENPEKPASDQIVDGKIKDADLKETTEETIVSSEQDMKQSEEDESVIEPKASTESASETLSQASEEENEKINLDTKDSEKTDQQSEQ